MTTIAKPTLQTPSTRWPPGGARLTPLLIAAGACVAVAAPCLASGYQLFVLTMIAIYAIAILGLNILAGFNGQISLGQGAFFAIGAYVTGILLATETAPSWAAVPTAAICCFVVGFLFGFPALRLEGVYLGLATFSLAVTTPYVLKSHMLEPWTGGVQGLVLSKPQAPWGLPLSDDQWLYSVCIIVAVLAFWLGRNILSGRIGRAIVAVRDNPTAAEAMGIDLAITKSTTFAVSALYAGLAGALAALATEFVSPDTFTVTLSISLLVGSVIGGNTSIIGAPIGAAFVVLLPNLADQVSKAAPSAIFGIVLIGLVLVAPMGLVGLTRRIWTAHRSNRQAVAR
ncbi:branched-chain amino acid ABC transporter permease [Bradyrhizobium sp. U87765 SZCCT0131]|uniref:branched-chain amino acid ABC transporter permease n=1 Tax=unclassified Bradyrhizobium TaxID=2631580 RepID=UPI001BA8C009|nr:MULTISPECIES: branched-chain amino acid ABC transporter permease [unclassified Bradyrhizobium]MBR1218814.1 branched-chain amino acid ABC transporter permease [Bradyrhizobium sp. U87765 SZCCT0131]MBR1261465.1 branched-chain amino acid ABC transporter permease [Bradyrhizobium sp. U87765 SZCCT0134]MBR1306682.1 branched-chain amino acid ABC transporter permease [Bradyrhizobium sp. U87765 SZCCT0110]MBR1317247.1 branched-chain amino acid ABC transporter permease [Bradyrhizobium sp. U87765 SZCCT010